MVTNIKLAFTNVSFRHNSARIVRKCLRFNRVIIIRFIFFRVSEHLAFPFFALAKSGSCVSHLRFFCLHSITCLGMPTVTSLILLIALNRPCYLHFSLSLFVWLIKLKFTPYPSHHQDCFRGYVIFIVLTPLNYRGLRFLKNQRSGMKIFLEKWGVVRDGSPYRGRGRLYKKGKLCFSLVMYGFCSSNAL